jgi:hypothetical protein
MLIVELGVEISRGVKKLYSGGRIEKTHRSSEMWYGGSEKEKSGNKASSEIS